MGTNFDAKESEIVFGRSGAHNITSIAYDISSRILDKKKFNVESYHVHQQMQKIEFNFLSMTIKIIK